MANRYSKFQKKLRSTSIGKAKKFRRAQRILFKIIREDFSDFFLFFSFKKKMNFVVINSLTKIQEDWKPSKSFL